MPTPVRRPSARPTGRSPASAPVFCANAAKNSSPRSVRSLRRRPAAKTRRKRRRGKIFIRVFVKKAKFSLPFSERQRRVENGMKSRDACSLRHGRAKRGIFNEAFSLKIRIRTNSFSLRLRRSAAGSCPARGARTTAGSASCRRRDAASWLRCKRPGRRRCWSAARRC